MVLDQRSPMLFGSQRCFKSVLGAHISSLLAWAALEQGDRVGGLIFGDTQQRDIRARRSKNAVLELLRLAHEYNLRLNSPVNAQATQSHIRVLVYSSHISKS